LNNGGKTLRFGNNFKETHFHWVRSKVNRLIKIRF
jgi:hypothetical protein